jgi:hypothetical protein
MLILLLWVRFVVSRFELSTGEVFRKRKYVRFNYHLPVSWIGYKRGENDASDIYCRVLKLRVAQILVRRAPFP